MSLMQSLTLQAQSQLEADKSTYTSERARLNKELAEATAELEKLRLAHKTHDEQLMKVRAGVYMKGWPRVGRRVGGGVESAARPWPPARAWYPSIMEDGTAHP